MNNKPSLESQFLAALLAFTTLMYTNVWLLKYASVSVSERAYMDTKTSAPDLSSMSREEVGEYLVREVKKQIENPSSYFAAAAKTVGGATDVALPPPASAPITPPAPAPTPTQQFQQQCNASISVADLSGLKPNLHGAPFNDLSGPRFAAGAQAVSEYYLVFTTREYPSNSLYVAHLGRDGLTFGGVEPLFRAQPGIRIDHVVASDRFIAYGLTRADGGQAVAVRYFTDGRPGGGDDQIQPIVDLSLIPGMRLVRGYNTDSPIQLAGNKLGIFVQWGSSIQQRHLLLYTLAPNGAPVRVEVPTASPIMRSYPTPSFEIFSTRVAASGAVTLYFVDWTPGSAAPWFFDFAHPGPDGIWGNGNDTRIAFGETQPTTASYPEISPEGQFVLWDSGPLSPTVPQALNLFDAGIDRIPGTPDDGGLFNIAPPQTPPGVLFWAQGVRDTTPLVASRPSFVSALAEEISTVAVTPRLFRFFESGPDQGPGAPDIRITVPSGPSPIIGFTPALRKFLEGDITFFSHWGALGPADGILRAIKWCY